jgi:biotin-[acetyl-CoA-carboxylase] ligase BirA-like protein
MIVLTDSISFAECLILPGQSWVKRDISYFDENTALKEIASEIFPDGSFYQTDVFSGWRWSFAFISEKLGLSNYDLMIDVGRIRNDLPHGLVFVAGESNFCHGHHGRKWTALPGNLHLTVFLTPKCRMAFFGTGFSILAAVSVVETIDGFQGLKGKAQIKWVNDIIIGEAKIAGFLAHTHSMGTEVESAIIGIGMNVETNPGIGSDDFIPDSVSLLELVSTEEDCDLGKVFRRLLTRLEKNYIQLRTGDYNKLLSFYRERSLVIGRKVKILSDREDSDKSVIASGVVRKIGDNLELYLEGREHPVTHGRLILE